MFWKILLLAAVLESLVEVIKWTFEGDMSKWRIVAFVGGVFITPLTGLDLFYAVGIPLSVPFIGDVGVIIGQVIGWILTGMIVSRGSTVVNDLFALLNKLRNSMTQVPTELIVTKEN